MKELIGKKIVGLWVSNDKEMLLFQTDQGNISYTVSGDCCSHSWFADILGVDALIGRTVLAVEEKELPDGYNLEDGRGTQEVDLGYGIGIRTDRGYVDIIFRNSSNGYYGGTLDAAEYGDSVGRMIPIAQDWSA